MTKLTFEIDDRLASMINTLAKDQYDGDQNALLSDALLQHLLQPIRKERRQLAWYIDEIRRQVQVSGVAADNDLEQLIKDYREQKRCLKNDKCGH